MLKLKEDINLQISLRHLANRLKDDLYVDLENVDSEVEEQSKVFDKELDDTILSYFKSLNDCATEGMGATSRARSFVLALHDNDQGLSIPEIKSELLKPNLDINNVFKKSKTIYNAIDVERERYYAMKQTGDVVLKIKAINNIILLQEVFSKLLIQFNEFLMMSSDKKSQSVAELIENDATLAVIGTTIRSTDVINESVSYEGMNREFGKEFTISFINQYYGAIEAFLATNKVDSITDSSIGDDFLEEYTDLALSEVTPVITNEFKLKFIANEELNILIAQIPRKAEKAIHRSNKKILNNFVDEITRIQVEA